MWRCWFDCCVAASYFSWARNGKGALKWGFVDKCAVRHDKIRTILFVISDSAESTNPLTGLLYFFIWSETLFWICNRRWPGGVFDFTTDTGLLLWNSRLVIHSWERCSDSPLNQFYNRVQMSITMKVVTYYVVRFVRNCRVSFLFRLDWVCRLDFIYILQGEGCWSWLFLFMRNNSSLFSPANVMSVDGRSFVGGLIPDQNYCCSSVLDAVENIPVSVVRLDVIDVVCCSWLWCFQKWNTTFHS